MKSRRLRAPSKLALNVSKDGAFTTSLGNLCKCLTTLSSPYILSESTLSCFKPIAPCPGTTGSAKSLSPSLPGCKAQQRGGRCPSIPQATFHCYSPNPSPQTSRLWKEQPVPEKWWSVLSCQCYSTDQDNLLSADRAEAPGWEQRHTANFGFLAARQWPQALKELTDVAVVPNAVSTVSSSGFSGDSQSSV